MVLAGYTHWTQRRHFAGAAVFYAKLSLPPMQCDGALPPMQCDCALSRCTITVYCHCTFAFTGFVSVFFCPFCFHRYHLTGSLISICQSAALSGVRPSTTPPVWPVLIELPHHLWW